MKSQADFFINRELSWIEFNKRVLLTGMEKEYKILDKVKFCSIFSNNLDEFFMVRVASLKAQVEAGITKKSIDGLTPKEQLTKINKEVKNLTLSRILYSFSIPVRSTLLLNSIQLNSLLIKKSAWLFIKILLIFDC